MGSITFGYWNIRGIGQPIRLLLEQSGLEWHDKLYFYGPTYEESSWFDEKESLGLEFPNLPYLIDGDLKLTQSPAILRYIARKVKLDGTTEVEKQRIDLIVGEMDDIKATFKGLCNNSNFETLKGSYLENLPMKFQKLSQFLGSQPYFGGNNLTFVDFIVYEVLDQHKVLSPNCLEDYANLEEFLERIEKLDRISAYMNSPRFIKYPLNNKFATFGG